VPGKESLTDILLNFDQGDAMDRLDYELQRVANGVKNTGKPGELQLTIKLGPNGAGAVYAQLGWKSKVPNPEVGSSTYFVGKSGELVKEDPRQTRFDLPRIDDEIKKPKYGDDDDEKH
jgi:hypothetical protein